MRSHVRRSNRQSEIHPTCFITPRTTPDVSLTLKTLTSLAAPFTVKSGGHTAPCTTTSRQPTHDGLW